MGRRRGDGEPGDSPGTAPSLTFTDLQWLEFPMHRVGSHLVKLAIASCAKESHQADIQHRLKEGKDHRTSISQADNRLAFPQKNRAWLLLHISRVLIPT